MTLDEQLMNDMKEAMRSGDRLRVDVMRGTRAALQVARQEVAKQQFDALVREIEKQYPDDIAAREAAIGAIEMDPRAPLSRDQEEAAIGRELKKRRDAAEIYRSKNQIERAEQEEREAEILATYLPKQLSADELRPQVAALIAEHGLSGAASLGKLMPLLMERFKGRADGKVLSQLARELLK